MTMVSVVISVGQDYINKMSTVAQELKSVGMTNIEVMSSVGVIAGQLDDSKIAEISSFKGIEHVEQSQDVQIESSCSDEQ